MNQPHHTDHYRDTCVTVKALDQSTSIDLRHDGLMEHDRAENAKTQHAQMIERLAILLHRM